MRLPYIVRYLFFSFAMMFLSSCTSMRFVSIETLQPAIVAIDAPRRNIAITSSMFPADSVVANALFSLQFFLENLPGYENSTFTTKTDEILDFRNFVNA